MASLLVYGTDKSLLRTRQWVLEQCGFNVFIALSIVEVEQAFAGQPVALLILCHSLSLADCRQALTLSYAVSPQTKKLLLHSQFKDLDGLVDAIFDPLEGPVEFIRAVRSLISMPAIDQAAPAMTLLDSRS